MFDAPEKPTTTEIWLVALTALLAAAIGGWTLLDILRPPPCPGDQCPPTAAVTAAHLATVKGVTVKGCVDWPLVCTVDLTTHVYAPGTPESEMVGEARVDLSRVRKELAAFHGDDAWVCTVDDDPVAVPVESGVYLWTRNECRWTAY